MKLKKNCLALDASIEDFYCHWYAEDEDAVFSALEQMGMNDVMVTLPIKH